MIKKFALVATVAALFVACSSENTESMEKSQPENSQELLDEANADAEVIVTPEVTVTDDAAIEGTDTLTEGEEGVVIDENN